MDTINNTLFSNQHFVIEQSHDCAIPGYLIVRPILAASRLDEIGVLASTHLGPTLALAVSAVREVISPIKIYCAQFGEASDLFHFHIFPRTAGITTEFLRDHPEQRALIHGPVLFDWARSKYRNRPVTEQDHYLIERIRQSLNLAS